MDKNSYALGMSIATNMMQSGVDELNFDDFFAGLKATFLGQDPAISYEEASKTLNDYFTKLEQSRKEALSEMGKKMKEEGAAFLAVNGMKEGVHTLNSGLQYKEIVKGNGKRPGPRDRVRCHYEGTLINGQKFDSSYDRNEPAVFGVNQVIAGWTEALQLMNEGSTWELYIPYNLAYGENGAGGSIPPFATLIFKVELIKVL